jgi:hypothetical protein
MLLLVACFHQVGAALAIILVKPYSTLFQSSIDIKPSEKLEGKDLGYAVVLYLWLLVSDPTVCWSSLLSSLPLFCSHPAELC